MIEIEYKKLDTNYIECKFVERTPTMTSYRGRILLTREEFLDLNSLDTNIYKFVEKESSK